MLAVTIDFAIAPKATTGEASSDTLLATLPSLSNDAILFCVYFALFYQRSVVVAGDVMFTFFYVLLLPLIPRPYFSTQVPSTSTAVFVHRKYRLCPSGF